MTMLRPERIFVLVTLFTTADSSERFDAFLPELAKEMASSSSKRSSSSEHEHSTSSALHLSILQWYCDAGKRHRASYTA